jgi:hypothetical protein
MALFTRAYQPKSVSHETMFFSHNKSASASALASAKKKQPAEQSLYILPCSLEFISQNQPAIQQYFSLTTNQHQHRPPSNEQADYI